jgi:hypothetical protein
LEAGGTQMNLNRQELSYKSLVQGQFADAAWHSERDFLVMQGILEWAFTGRRIFADFSKTSFRKMGTIPAAEPKPKTDLDIIILTA